MKDETQTTPVVNLDDIMTKALQTFEGELDQQAAPKETPDHPAPVPDTDAGPAPEGTGPHAAKEPDEHPKKDEHISPEQKETQPAVKPVFRFTSHEDAEKGYKNLQAEKTRLEMELRAAREKNTAIEQTEAEKTWLAAFEEDVSTYAKEANRKALKAIDELDPDAEDYQGQVAEIQARVYGDIRRYEREKENKKPKPGGALSGERGESGKGASDEVLRIAQAHVRDVAEKNQINPDDEYFRMVCTTAPTVDEKGLPMDFDTQILWAVHKTKTYQAELQGAHGTQGEQGRQNAANRKAAATQEENLAMGRSTPQQRRSEMETARPVSLDDAIESALESRRL
jgi:hypothetical protein